MAPNCLEFIEIVAGLSSVGIAPAMVNPRLTGPELAYIANDSRARVLFVHHSLEELARATAMETVERIVVIGGDYEELLAQASPLRTVVPIEEWEPFCISYTAGTTGHPKGAMLSHRSRVLTFFGMAAEYGCYSPEDRALAVAPLYHGGGFAFAMAPVFFGGTCEILPRFDAELMLRIDSESRITNQFMVPTHFNAIFALEEYFATTDQKHPTYEAATALYRKAVPENQRTATALITECTPPDVPTVPDGASASMEEMVAGQKQVKAFVAAGEAYLKCLAKVIDSKDRAIEERNAAVSEHNRMVGTMEQIAAGFNDQIKKFKSRG